MNPSRASRVVLPSLGFREARTHEETPLPGSTSGSTGKHGKHDSRSGPVPPAAAVAAAGWSSLVQCPSNERRGQA